MVSDANEWEVRSNEWEATGQLKHPGTCVKAGHDRPSVAQFREHGIGPSSRRREFAGHVPSQSQDRRPIV